MGKKNRKSRRPGRRRKPIADPDRLKRRVMRLRPRGWEGERAEDVAVFDEAALEQLSPELTEQVVAVKEALQLVSDSLGQEANRRLSKVPRSSPMGQWRLLIRGMVDWYDNNIESASECWRRLDPQRRPARIAKALESSRRSDLDSPSAPTSADDTDVSTFGSLSLDSSLLSAAKLVRQTRISRPAILEAASETAKRERQPPGNSKTLHLGPERFEWLKAFAQEYRQLEPNLVDALQAAAIDRVYKQPYVDIFQSVTGLFAGPPHDPTNTLLKSMYHGKFEGGDQRSDQLMRQYLTKQLPNNQRISKPLRDAIQSEGFLNEARAEMTPQESGVFGRYWDDEEDDSAIILNFKNAIKAYPANLAAHREFIAWIQSRAEDRRDKSVRDRFEKRLPPAMKAWSKALPQEIEPRLWLVDHFLQCDELEEAKPHVDWLSQSRHPDPRVRSTPWKWQLLEAMRLCRRKSWLPQVSEKLDAAEEIWPTWLRKDWLPYLRAALSLRMERTDEYQQQRESIRQERMSSDKPFSTLTDDLMMLGAAQRMRVPAAVLGPLREPIDRAAKAPTLISFSDLICAGDFFWDLHRTSLLYPAYRMHGSKFGAELKARLKASPRIAPDVIKLPEFWGAVLWMSERRCFTDSYNVKMPRCLLRLHNEPKLAAAIIHTILNARSTWRLRNYQKELDLLRNAALTTKDPYDRYWFDSLVRHAEEELTKKSDDSWGSFGGFADLLNRFSQRANPASADDDFLDELNEDDELDFDPQCTCPECTAAREAAGYPHPESESTDEQLEFPFARIDSAEADVSDSNWEPPPPSQPKRDISRDPELRRTRPKNPMAKKRRKNKQ